MFPFLGKVQITLVWNSRNEKSPSSDKLESLAKVTTTLILFFGCNSFAFFLFEISSLHYNLQFLWRNGGSRSREHYIHSVWANFQTSTNNVS